MHLLSLVFLLACGDKGTDSAVDTAAASPSTEPANPSTEPANPSTEPANPSSEPSSPSTEPANPASEPSGETADATNGANIVNSTCMGCHSGNTKLENSANMTDQEIKDLLANGKNGMPPQNSLSEQDVLDVIAHLRATYGGGQ
jgi:mono/diheme cytochrome c family protein